MCLPFGAVSTSCMNTEMTHIVKITFVIVIILFKKINDDSNSLLIDKIFKISFLLQNKNHKEIKFNLIEGCQEFYFMCV